MVGRKPKVLRLTRFGAACSGVLPLAAVSLAVLVAGCGKGAPNDQAEAGAAARDKSTAVFDYPSSLSADSSPEDVVRALIKALDEEDKKTLAGLVAVKAEMEAVEEIYHRRGRKSDIEPEGVVTMVVAGWGATYVFFQPGQTRVDRGSAQGDTAVVFATGKRPDGEPSTLKINLLHEDGRWKVRAGLESASQ